jgi:hypothetical protein
MREILPELSEFLRGLSDEELRVIEELVNLLEFLTGTGGAARG